MTKTSKDLGKMLLLSSIISAVSAGISLIIIYAELSHRWDWVFGFVSFWLAIFCILMVPVFLVSLAFGKKAGDA